MKINLCWKVVKETLLIFVLFPLRHSKGNLRTSTYIFYKSTAPANIIAAVFLTF